MDSPNSKQVDDVVSFQADTVMGKPPTKLSIAKHKEPISVDDAIITAAEFLDLGTPQKFVHNDFGVQIIQETVTPAGDTIAKRVGFDFNPAKLDGGSPHLNLQTQKNRKIIRNGPYADPHVNVDPNTIKKGDY